MRLLTILCFLLTLFPELKSQPRTADNSEDIHFTVKVKVNKTEYADQVILKLPSTYSKTGNPVRLVYCAHGAGGGVSAKGWFFNNFALVDTLLANGYAVFDVNGGAVENMGGPLVVKSAFMAYQTIHKNYNVSDKIFVIGGSMGGLSSTNFVYRHPEIVLSHGLYSAVLDLYEQAWLNPWLPTTRKAIANACNFKDKSGNTWEENRTRSWNPMNRNNEVNGLDTLKPYPVPVKIWHGTGDKVVSVNSSRMFQRYIKNANGSCELHEVDSDDHNLSCGSPMFNHELIQFFRRYELNRQ